jgi:hypothetical protein
MTELLPDPFAPRTSHIIGRAAFIAAIRSAIADSSGSQIFFFTGPGGIGKTRLLEEVDVILKELDDQQFLQAEKIIDLYHADNHSPGGLRDAIVNGLDPEGKNKSFANYRALHQEYNRKRLEGVGDSELEEMRKQLDPQFQKEYAELAAKQRLVLRFDTLELIQYESDIVQEIGRVQEVESAVKTWLLEQVVKFPNTITLFAGRPHRQVQSDFTKWFQDSVARFSSFELEGFTPAEARAYLDDLRKEYPNVDQVLIPDVEQWIFDLPQIRPIYLTLILDLLLHGGDVPAEIFAIPDTGTPPDGGDKRDSVEDLIGMRLVERLIHLPPPFDQIFDFLLRARKGLNADLLRHLADPEWSDDDVRSNLDKVRSFAIIKARPGTDQLFLHDEVYDLWDRYFQDDPAAYNRRYLPIAQYYRRRLEFATTPEEHENLLIALLYYELQVDAYVGYHRCYARWDEVAIRSHEIGFDMRLRDEMLRFVDRYINPHSPYAARRVSARIEQAEIDRDSAVRWVKRYRSRADISKALQVAQDIRTSTNSTFAWDVVDDPIYKAELLVAWAKTLAYGAPEQEAIDLLSQAIQYLEVDGDWNADQRWWQAEILARAYNDLGYLYRVRGHYGLALGAYKRALPYLTETETQSRLLLPHYSSDDIAEEQATTLNNLAFLLTQLGRVAPALNHVEQALAIRTKISERYKDRKYREYPLALSHNTRGRIYTFQNHPMWGERECRIALATCESLQDARGIGLCCNAVGLALRKRGDQWKIDAYTPEESEKFFKEAAEHFLRAAGIFSPDRVNEPLRLWEAYNELGSLYCDWGWLCHQKFNNANATTYYQESIKYHELALTEAHNHDLPFQIADSYDDLAQAYGDQRYMQGRADQPEQAAASRAAAEGYLDRILEVTPEPFRLEARKGFPTPPEPGESYWLLLGKVHYRRGTWAFRDIEYGLVAQDNQQKQLEQALRQFIFSAIYFERYWPQSFALEQTLNRFGRFLFRYRAAISSDWARKQVQGVSKEYNINLDVVKSVIEDALGV